MATIEEMRAALKAGNPTATTQTPVEQMRAELKNSPPEVLNESAGLSGRFAVKNFGGSTEDQIDYLRSKNPGVEITTKQEPGMLWGTNEAIVARRPGEASYKKLDPSGFSLSDLPADIGDIAYDIPAGVAQGVATAAGGLAGAPTGVGALPAAAAAGSASGTALEAARQGIGNYLGTAKGLDTAGLKTTAAVGAAAPLLFGAGASSAGIKSALQNPETVAKILSKQGLADVAPGAVTAANRGTAEAAVAAAQRGAVPRVFDQAFSRATSTFTGAAPAKIIQKATAPVSQDLVQELAKRYDINPAKTYTNLELGDLIHSQGIGSLGDDAAKGIKEVLSTANEETGLRISNALADAPEMVNVGKYSEGLDEYVKANTAAFERTKNSFFDEEATRAKELTKVFGPADGSAGGDYLMRADDAFAFKTKLNELIGGAKSPLVLDKKSAVSKNLTGKLIEAERGLAGDLDKILSSGGAPGAREAYRQNKDIARYLLPKFANEEVAVKTLRNIDLASKPLLRDKMGAFDKEYGTDLLGLSDLVAVSDTFSNPSAEAVARRGSYNTGKLFRASAIGGSAGYLAGLASGVPGAAQVLGTLGVGVGAALTSPAMVKSALQSKTALDRLVKSGMDKSRASAIIEGLKKNLEKLPAVIQPAASPTAASASSWNMLNNGGQE